MDPMAAGEKTDSLRQRDFSQWSAVVEFLRLTLSRIGATGQRAPEPYLFSTVVTRRLSTDSPRHDDRKRVYCPSHIPRPAESIWHRQMGPGLHAGGASQASSDAGGKFATPPGDGNRTRIPTRSATSQADNGLPRVTGGASGNHRRVARESSAGHPRERT